MTFWRQDRKRLVLTPMMETALAAMKRGDLRLASNVGWLSSVGVKGIWNSHTIKFLAGRGYCVIKGGRATVTDEGRKALDDAMGYAA